MRISDWSSDVCSSDLCLQRTPVPEDAPIIEADESEDTAHRGGLAGTVGAQKPDHAAGRYLELRAVEGEHLAVALREAVQFEHASTIYSTQKGRAELGSEWCRESVGQAV